MLQMYGESEGLFFFNSAFVDYCFGFHDSMTFDQLRSKG